MQRIKTEFGRNNLWFRLVKRSDTLAMYSVHLTRNDPKSVGYEVVLIRVRDAETIRFPDGTVRTLPKREVLPSNGEFGVWGWSWLTEEQAESDYTAHTQEARPGGMLSTPGGRLASVLA